VKTKNKILVALDLEAQSVVALKYAEHFAEILDYELDVITVVEESSLLSRLFSGDEVEKKLNKDVQEQVDKLIEPYTGKVKINTTISYGKVYEEIIQYAKMTQPSLIFMGKSEMPKYKRAFLGSNSLHVILESDFPVITIRGEYDFEKYKKEHKDILVPLDLKKDISEQISAAVEFTKLFDSSLYLYAVERKGSAGEKTKMLTQLAKVKEALVKEGVKCKTELVSDEKTPVYELICQEAEKCNASLIVIMTRDENKFTDLFMGSNARDIINNSDIPVLSIEPWNKEEGSKVFSQFIDVLNLYNK
jgi:nucleotide-binding universal stress UspA family protein